MTERLEHGSLDFATLLTPIDPARYEFLPLPDHSYWGLLVRADSPLADRACLTPAELLPEPLILHRRAGLQREIAQWAGVAPEQLNIAAAYNVIHGSALSFVQSGLGSLLITRDLLDPELDANVRFLPLSPTLETHSALVWKRESPLSRPAAHFVEMMRKNL